MQSVRQIIFLRVCVHQPVFDVGLFLASEDLSQSHLIGQQFCIAKKATKWEQFSDIHP